MPSVPVCPCLAGWLVAGGVSSAKPRNKIIVDPSRLEGLEICNYMQLAVSLYKFIYLIYLNASVRYRGTYLLWTRTTARRPIHQRSSTAPTKKLS